MGSVGFGVGGLAPNGVLRAGLEGERETGREKHAPFPALFHSVPELEASP